MFTRILFAWAIMASTISPLHAAPLSDEYKVNTTAASVVLTGLSTGDNGDTSVSMREYRNGGPLANYVQRYDYMGNRFSPTERYYGIDTSGVADNNNGRFVFARNAPDGSGSGVYLSVYARNGSLSIPEFGATARVLDNQNGGKVVMNSAGFFGVLWQNQATGLSQSFARIFNTTGVPRTGDILLASIGTTPSSWDYASDLSIDGSGNIAAVGVAYSAGKQNIWLKRFNSLGVKIANVSPLNSASFSTAIQDLNPSIATAPDGTSIIVWERFDQFTKIMGVKVSSLGARLEPEFTIATLPAGANMAAPKVAIRADGKFVVTWQYLPLQGKRLVYAQAFNANTVPNGGAFVVGPLASTLLGIGANGISIDPDPVYDNFTIGWTAVDAMGHVDVYARRYNMR